MFIYIRHSTLFFFSHIFLFVRYLLIFDYMRAAWFRWHSVVVSLLHFFSLLYLRLSVWLACLSIPDACQRVEVEIWVRINVSGPHIRPSDGLRMLGKHTQHNAELGGCTHHTAQKIPSTVMRNSFSDFPISPIIVFVVVVVVALDWKTAWKRWTKIFSEQTGTQTHSLWAGRVAVSCECHNRIFGSA